MENDNVINLMKLAIIEIRKQKIIFPSTNTASKSLIEAVNILNDLNEAGKRKIPDDAPTKFISNRWDKYLYDKDRTINRHYYEIATFTELKNRIRSGDISVEGSKKFKDFEE